MVEFHIQALGETFINCPFPYLPFSFKFCQLKYKILRQNNNGFFSAFTLNAVVVINKVNNMVLRTTKDLLKIYFNYSTHPIKVFFYLIKSIIISKRTQKNHYQINREIV